MRLFFDADKIEQSYFAQIVHFMAKVNLVIFSDIKDILDSRIGNRKELFPKIDASPNFKFNEWYKQKKSRIWETLTLSTDADSSTDTKTDTNGRKGIFFSFFFLG